MYGQSSQGQLYDDPTNSTLIKHPCADKHSADVPHVLVPQLITPRRRSRFGQAGGCSWSA